MHALMQYEFLVLYPVNPKALARYREVFAPSGAKDDPTDAAVPVVVGQQFHRDGGIVTGRRVHERSGGR